MSIPAKNSPPAGVLGAAAKSDTDQPRRMIRTTDPLTGWAAIVERLGVPTVGFLLLIYFVGIRAPDQQAKDNAALVAAIRDSQKGQAELVARIEANQSRIMEALTRILERPR